MGPGELEDSENRWHPEENQKEAGVKLRGARVKVGQVPGMCFTRG